MNKVKIPIKVAMVLSPEIHEIGNVPRKKKKKMKKEFSKIFSKKFSEWIENGKPEL